MTFSDNAASFVAIKALTKQSAALVAQRDKLQERLNVHNRACKVGIMADACCPTHTSITPTASVCK